MIKPTNIKILSVIILIFANSIASATNYYVNASIGNNNYDGLSESTAWQTLQKVNQSTFLPGDSILLKRGDVWRETLVVPSSGIDGKHIIFTTYGAGEKPRILGSEQVESWNYEGNNIWSSSNNLNDPHGQYEGNIYFENEREIKWGSPKKDYDSGFTELTQEYDWTWYGNKIYIYSEGNPGSIYDAVEVGQRNNGIYLNNKDYITINGLDIRYAKLSAIKEAWPFTGEVGLEISHCFITHIGARGSLVGYGIESYHSHTHIHHNEIQHTGRRSMSIRPQDGDYPLVQDSVVIEHNIVANSYHGGIGIAVASNGAAIKNVHVRNNFCYNDSEEIPVNWTNSQMGTIGLRGQNLMENINFYNNISVGASRESMGISNSQNVKVFNNVFYGVNQYSEYFSAQLYIDGDTKDIEVKNNIFVNDHPQELYDFHTCIYAGSGWSNIDIDYNLYYITKGQGIANIQGYGGYFEIEAWEQYRNNTGWDKHSLIQLAPLFSGPEVNNFTLQPQSPAIGAGVNVGLTKDYAGNNYNNPPSIGAFEFNTGESHDRTDVIILFPNPSTGYLTILREESASEIQNFRVIDISGKIVFEGILEEGVRSSQFFLNLSSGVYIVNVFSGNLSKAAGKIIFVNI